MSNPAEHSCSHRIVPDDHRSIHGHSSTTLQSIFSDFCRQKNQNIRKKVIGRKKETFFVEIMKFWIIFSEYAHVYMVRSVPCW